MSKIFIVFRNFKLVSGKFRSALYDFQRCELHLIPNKLFEFCETLRTKPLTGKGIINQFSDIGRELIDEYITWLIDHEFAIYGTRAEYDLLKNIPYKYESPYKILNAIIDLSSTANFAFKLSKLINVECQNIQIRVLNKELDISSVFEKLSVLSDTNVKNVELIIPHNSIRKDNFYKSMTEQVPRITLITIYNSSQSRLLKYKGARIVYIKEDLKDIKQCGVINPSYFAINYETISISKNNNSCLYGKVSIDNNGYVKNCPSMSHHYGHINDVDLTDVLNNRDFLKYWNISKDQISVCKICEFRYICTDCRAYLENPKDLYSKPLKCGYDPITGNWTDWKKNKLKKEAIKYYSIDECI